MKYLTLMFICSAAMAGPVSQRVDSSVFAIPPNFGSSVNTALANLNNLSNITTICADNRTAVEIAVNCSSHSSTTNPSVPSDSSTGNIYVNAGQSTCLDNPSVKGDCYIRSMNGSSISSGIFVLTAITK